MKKRSKKQIEACICPECLVILQAIVKKKVEGEAEITYS